MTQKRISRGWKVLIIVSIVLILALVFVNLFATWYVKNTLEKSFSSNKPGGYALYFEKLYVNVLTGTVGAVNIHFSSSPSPASEVARKVDFRARSVKFSGIG